MIFFARRLLRLEPDGKYADVIERELYNGALSGVSMDGKSFFYVNPLELEPDFNQTNIATSQKVKRPITQRVEVFRCSCCPPNVVRVFASMSDLLYSRRDDTLFVHQYAQSEAPGIRVETDYPVSGNIKLQLTGVKEVALRIPGWCGKFTLSAPYRLEKGYAYVAVPEDGKITLELDMPVEIMEADSYVPQCAGKVALMRGPVVYCLEGVDNGQRLRNMRLDLSRSITTEASQFFGIPVLKARGMYKEPGQGLYRRYKEGATEKELTFIPYFGFANRGESEMYVWVQV